MKNAREELNKIKDLWGLSTDEEFANKLNISKETVNSWIKRNKIPEKWILKIGQMNQDAKKLQTIINAKDILEHHISDKELEILKAYRSLPKQRQELIYHKIKAEEIEYGNQEGNLEDAKYA